MILTLEEGFTVEGRTYDPVLYLDVYEHEQLDEALCSSYRTERTNEEPDKLREEYGRALLEPGD